MAGPIKVAILDDYQGFSDKHFAPLRESGDYEVATFRDTLLPYEHPDTPDSVRDRLAERLEPFAVICEPTLETPLPRPTTLTCRLRGTMRERTPFPRALLERLPNLKLLLTTGKRNASLDMEWLSAHGIPVAGAVDMGKTAKPGAVGSDSTTEHAVAMTLALARGLAEDDAVVKGRVTYGDGTGGASASAPWQTSFATGLSGKTLGLVGLGRLGGAVGRVLRLAFGMRVVAWSENLTQGRADAQAAALGLPVADPVTGEKTFLAVGKAELFASADVVSVHLVLSERSRGIVAAADLEQMRPSALFVNTSRGPLVVEKDLLEVLKQGKIRGAALDVFDLEPLPAESEWRTTKWGQEGRGKVLLTPHMGYVEEDTMNDWYAQLAANVVAFKEGRELTTRIV